MVLCRRGGVHHNLPIHFAITNSIEAGQESGDWRYLIKLRVADKVDVRCVFGTDSERDTNQPLLILFVPSSTRLECFEITGGGFNLQRPKRASGPHGLRSG